MAEKDTLSKDYTTCVNGIFISIVFISHLRAYMALPEWLEYTMRSISQLMVVPFLFYSGFGITESIKKKGKDYVRSIPVKRVFRVWIRFASMVLIYAVLDLILGLEFSFSDFLWSLVAWKNIGNSNWYIFVILCLYLVTWAGFETGYFFGEKKSGSQVWIRNISLAATAVFGAGLYVFLHEFSSPLFYNTMSAYFFGVIVSLYRDRLSWIKPWAIEIICMVISAGAVVLLRTYGTHASVFLIMSILFCIFVVCASRYLPFPDRIFKWLGVHLFEIYILMRIPMIVLLKVDFMKDGGVIYALCCALITVLMAWGVHELIEMMSKKKS